MGTIKVITTGILLLSAQYAPAHERAWPGKRLASLWPEAARFTSKQVNLSAAQAARLEAAGIRLGAEDKSPVFYFAGAAGKGKNARPLGIILFIDAYGANGNMEISVGMTADGAVAKLGIWEHSEDKRVAGGEFLGQFIGKKSSDSFQPGAGYKPAEGAQQASGAVALAVKKALSITGAVFGPEAGAPGKSSDGAIGKPATGKTESQENGARHE